MTDTKLQFISTASGSTQRYYAKLNGTNYQGIVTDGPTFSKYLTFTALENNSTVSLVNVNNNAPELEYSTDGTTWVDWKALDYPTISLTNAGDRVQFRGLNPDGFNNIDDDYIEHISSFEFTGHVDGSGSIMSLIDGNGLSTSLPLGSYGCFMYLFFPRWTGSEETETFNPGLVHPPELTATDIIWASACYWGMFGGCSSLISAPVLPETTYAIAAENGYGFMFAGCTSLTTAPELPATTLLSGCYTGMFLDCTSLTTPPILPATTLADYCYNEMFSGCTSLKVSNAPASGYTHFFTCPSTIASDAVTGMFSSTGGSYTSDPVANGTYYYYQ